MGRGVYTCLRNTSPKVSDLINVVTFYVSYNTYLNTYTVLAEDDDDVNQSSKQPDDDDFVLDENNSDEDSDKEDERGQRGRSGSGRR